jgi:uncharacterized membrane protein
VFRVLLAAHLTAAFGAAALFWIPIAASKGGPLHRAAGRVYARLIYVTAVTGVPLAAALFAANAEPHARRTAFFLAYLLAILVMPVHHGIRVVRAARGETAMSSPLHTALCAAAILSGVLLAPFAIAWREWPYLLLSPIGPVLGIRALAYARAARTFGAPAPRWREEHIINMVMSGIAVHTAMLVFGLSRTLGLALPGMLAMLPWLVPAVVGLPALAWTINRERALSS